MKSSRKELKKDQNSEEAHMTKQNLLICVQNSKGYQTMYLNDSLHLQYYSFGKIENLQLFVKQQNQANEQQIQDHVLKDFESKGVNTIFLNNNLITKIQNLSCLKTSLKTLNISYNKIEKIEGLNQLINLSVLDVSNNVISSVPQDQINKLKNLTQFNLGHNQLLSFQSIKGISALGLNLQFLSLISNPNLEQNTLILTELLQKLKNLKVLYIKDTQFSRKTPSYRKQVLIAIQSLTFLDDRPITDDERFLAKAWKRGGLVQQRQARKRISQKNSDKNLKIMNQIQERNKVVNQKAEKIFQLKTQKEQNQLNELLKQKASEDYELMDQEDRQTFDLKVQDLQKYLQLFKQQCKSMDLDLQLGLKGVELPKMIIQNRTNECIYIYNVSESQLSLIKEKYYPQENLPLKVVNYEKQEELRWISQYRPILAHIYKISRGDIEMIEPLFNLQIYEFDLNTGRKLKRFRKDELEQLIQQKLDSELYEDRPNRPKIINELDNLD